MFPESEGAESGEYEAGATTASEALEVAAQDAVLGPALTNNTWKKIVLERTDSGVNIDVDGKSAMVPDAEANASGSIPPPPLAG
jgi:hypothetical protein